VAFPLTYKLEDAGRGMVWVVCRGKRWPYCYHLETIDRATIMMPDNVDYRQAYLDYIDPDRPIKARLEAARPWLDLSGDKQET